MSATYLSLSPVTAAVFAALNVASLRTLATGGVWDDLPRAVTFPCVLIVVREQAQYGGFGTKPGAGMLPEVGVRIHVFSDYGGMKTAHAVMAKVVELLSTPNALSVTGYTVCGDETFLDDTIPLGNELINGVPVKELVTNWRIYVEEAA